MISNTTGKLYYIVYDCHTSLILYPSVGAKEEHLHIAIARTKTAVGFNGLIIGLTEARMFLGIFQN